MTERSYFWNGLVTGDAVLAPYTHNIWHDLWQIMFTRGNSEGVLSGIDNGLVVSGVSTAVSITTGAALVDGSLYESSAVENITIPTPVTDPRIDRIVLKKDWLLQTIRVSRVAGTEAASPTAPALTQTDFSLWELPLAQILIATNGVITVTDERELAKTRLAPIADIREIETLVGDGIITSLNFSSIPSTFKHLLLMGNLSMTSLSQSAIDVFLNNDTNFSNYSRSLLLRFAGTVAAGGNSGSNPMLILKAVGADRDVVQKTVGIKIYFANYKNTTFYKTALATENEIPNETVNDYLIGREGGLWMNTERIHTINLSGGDILADETILTLYGLS